MVQSLKLGGAKNGQATSSIKRLNRVPVIVVIVLAVAFFAIIFIGLASRGLHFARNSGPDVISGTRLQTQLIHHVTIAAM
ncbi:hypothetical protein [Agrobacterium sp. SORGH_AS 787]|uniref:hypothetical protein n=1 Tax=Agrobacterium sp. SORGH_AS 787 TaxID=3041775 RepID=UPI0032B7384B